MQVAQDREQPGPKRQVTAAQPPSAERAFDRVLNEVVGQVAVPRQRQRETPERQHMRLDFASLFQARLRQFPIRITPGSRYYSRIGQIATE